MQPEDNVHLLLEVARARLCRVDLEFGDERVARILDTGAQHSLWNTSSYKRMRAQVPPLMKPPTRVQGVHWHLGKATQ